MLLNTWLSLRTAFLGVLISLAGIGFVAAQEKNGRTVKISIAQFQIEEERTAWLAYGIGLGGWIEKTGFAKVAPEGPFSPSFEAEVSARETQIKVWGELNEKTVLKLPYMDVMQQVAAANLLREYVWHYHRSPSWALPSDQLRIEELEKWRNKNLEGHSPQTGASVAFGPPKSSQ